MSATEFTEEPRFRIEEFTIDLRRGLLHRGPDPVHLTRKPFNVLVHLVRNRRQVVSKAELLKAVWGEHHEGNSVEQAIRQVRMALGDEKEHPRFIQTIPGEGYCFIASVRAIDEPTASEQLNTSVAPAITLSRRQTDHGLKRWISNRWRVLAVLVCGLTLAVALRPTSPDPKVANPIRITRSQNRILSPILTDGARLYYQRFENGRYMVSEVASAGGETITPTIDISNPELCDLSPDGGSLLIRDLVHSRDDNEPVYIQPALGGTSHRIGDFLAYDVAWFPDRQHIVYSAEGAVYQADLEGGSRQQLATVPGNAYWFRWSPDGRRLRFTVIDPKRDATSLWEATPDGRNPRRLFPAFKDPQCCGTWTPDGKYFIFQVRAENTYQIWFQRERGSLFFRANYEPLPLIVGPVNYRGPVPSKDGRKLFLRLEVPKGELVRYDKASKHFITVLPSMSVRTAAFSKDERWIAYTSLADNNLWRCRADGTECLQLTHGMQQTVLPRWSPDGQVIAFMGRHFGQKWGIFTVAATGENLHALSFGNRNEGDPDWSPDGAQLVFGNVIGPSDTMAIYILDLRTRHVSTVTGSTDHFSPRWSPDGRFIVAMRSADQRLDMFELATQKWTTLTQIAAGYPNWSHDGKHVYFLNTLNGRRAVFRAGITDGTVQEVTGLTAVERGPFFMGDWVGLAPDDSPMAVRNLTTEDIYSWDFQDR